MRGTNPLYGTIRGKCLEVLAHKKVTAGGEFKMRVIAGAPGGSTDRLFQVLRVCVDDDEDLATTRGTRPRFAPGETMELEFHIGNTGSGKTQTVMRAYPDAYLVTYDCGGSGVYFDDYKGEEIIIFDDCEDIAQHIPFRAALKLFDTAPCKWQVKHKAPVTVMAKKVIFTSVCPPLELSDHYAHKYICHCLTTQRCDRHAFLERLQKRLPKVQPCY